MTDDLTRQIEDALRRLPIRVEANSRTKFWAATLAFSLESTSWGTILDTWATPHEIQAHQVPHRRAAKELRELAGQIETLRATIERLSITADWALDPEPAIALKALYKHMPADLPAMVRRAAEDASRAVPVRGRLPDTASADLAVLALQAYVDLTGREPSITVDAISGKAGGTSLELVTAVFQAGGLSASPEHFARLATKDERLAALVALRHRSISHA